MSSTLPWLAGVFLIVAIVWYVKPRGFLATIAAVGLPGIGLWVMLTLIARLLLAETTVLPLRALDFHLPRADVFWISWIRTLLNQFLPLSGMAAYVRIVRARIGISWSELAALATPQFILAFAALGIVGLFATALNLDILQSAAIPIAGVYLALLLVSLAISSGAAWFIDLLPAALSLRAARIADTARKLATHRNLVARLVLIHGAAILFRGGRMWILFGAAGVTMTWSEFLMVLVIVESTMLVNVTPGGLGIREALVLGGSALAGIPAPVAASVALVDRLFVIVMAAVLTVPAIVRLRAGGQRADADRHAR